MHVWYSIDTTMDKKVNKSGYTRKDTGNEPGSAVSIDQIQSAQSGLFQKLSSKLTSARIWSDQVMVDHFSDVSYVHLMRSRIQ